jgi:hypothetical protein
MKGFTAVLNKKPGLISQCQSVKRNPCGSGLAREDGGTLNIDVA